MYYVGVDFGSTYTTVSVYDEETETLSAKVLSEGGSPFIPSVLAVGRNDQTVIGQEAKRMLGRGGKRARGFRAFKMMLAEEDGEAILARGFDEVYTPYRVTRDFLETVLREVLRRENRQTIDQLVVGVPEVWNDELSTVDGRSKLRDICRSFPFISQGDDSVRVVSEPAAASAYFSYNFRRETGKNFDGLLLLIDYGGGTLDITLTDVATRPDDDGREAMEIRVLKRTGAGENEERGQIGRAGIVYMETLAREAIREALPDAGEVPFDAAFSRAVDSLENDLQECTSMIKDVFDEYGTEEEDLDEENLEDEYIFTEIPYKNAFVPVSYRQMVRVYNQTIRGVLDEKLDEIIRYVNDHTAEQGGDVMDRNADNFKIALVGGFCNFYLVREQVTRKYQFNSIDRRQEFFRQGQEDCEKAISLGAALLASGVIRIRNTAPYSIGIWADDSATLGATYGLYLNEDIEFNQVYLQRNAKGEVDYFLALEGKLDRFVINMKDDERTAMMVTPKPQFRDRLNNIVTSSDGLIVVGFSLDSSGVLTLHIYDYDLARDVIDYGTDQKIELTNFRELFDIQRPKLLWKDRKSQG